MDWEQKIREWGDKFGRDVLERARRNLGASQKVKEGDKYRVRRRVASGRLKDSLLYKMNVKKGALEILFTTSDDTQSYAGVIEYGRRAGAKQPPPEAIKKWIKEKNVRLRKIKVVNGNKVSTFVPTTEKNLNSAAFLMGRAISRRGIMGIKYYENAILDAIDDLTPDDLDEFIEALDLILGESIK